MGAAPMHEKHVFFNRTDSPFRPRNSAPAEVLAMYPAVLLAGDVEFTSRKASDGEDLVGALSKAAELPGRIVLLSSAFWLRGVCKVVRASNKVRR